MYKILAVTTAAMIIGAATFSSSLAQSDSEWMPRMGMMGGKCPMMGMMGHGHMARGMMQGRRGMDPSRMGAMVEGRLAYLKAELNITKAQEPAWEEYHDAAINRVSIMQGMRQSMMESMHSGTAIERMETRINSMEAMLEAVKAVKPSVENLYANLSDSKESCR